MNYSTRKDIGKICWFWNNENNKQIGVLESVMVQSVYMNAPADCIYKIKDHSLTFRYSRPLTETEMKEQGYDTSK